MYSIDMLWFHVHCVCLGQFFVVAKQRYLRRQRPEENESLRRRLEGKRRVEGLGLEPFNECGRDQRRVLVGVLFGIGRKISNNDS